MADVSWWQPVADVLIPTAVTAGSGLVMAGLTYAVRWARAKVQAADLGRWNEVANLAFDELDAAVTKLQPLADAAKANAVDGKLTDLERENLRKQAVAYVTETLKPAGIDVAKAIPGAALDAWLTHIVQSRKDPSLRPVLSAAERLAAPPATLKPLPPPAAPTA